MRLPLLSPKFLVGTVGSDLLIKSDEACRDLVDEAKNYLLLPQERPLMQGPRTRPRKPVRRGEVLFAGQLTFQTPILSYRISFSHAGVEDVMLAFRVTNLHSFSLTFTLLFKS